MLPVIGVFVAYMVAPSPPQAHLIGKDMTYAIAFTEGFQSRAKKLQRQAATGGCIVHCLAFVAWTLFTEEGRESCGEALLSIPEDACLTSGESNGCSGH